MSESAPYFKYWGKTDRGDLTRYHLLPYHCFDVAAVASVWWDLSPVIRNRFLHIAEMDEDQIKAWLLFFVALHDYGKFDIRFQRKADHVLKLLQPQLHEKALPNLHTSTGYDHGSAGLYWFGQDHHYPVDPFSNQCSDFVDPFVTCPSSMDNWEAWRPWIESVCGHHGYIHRENSVKEWPLPSTTDPDLAAQEKETRIKWVQRLEQFFLSPCDLSFSCNPPPPSPLLAGFCSVSDWLGSRSDEECFDFCYEIQPLKHYFEGRLQIAKKVLTMSGMIGKSRSYAGIRAILPDKAAPCQLQRTVDELPVERGLTIVEAPTGTGKTELAMAYAWRLIEKGLAESIVFALPTQATANRMYDRLKGLSTEVFINHPNLLLAHGNARFNESFISVKHSSQTAPQEGEAWAQCCQWLSQSRKRVFLGQIGVCTVDQVLIAVLPVRHRFIRGFGAARSVLIVDEVHAYDAYMYGLMQQILKDQRAAGGSAILLSATLASHHRKTLLDSWSAIAQPEEMWNVYPLVTWAGASDIQLFHHPAADDRQNEGRVVHTVSRFTEDMRPDHELFQEMVAAAEKGAQVGLICNLVDHAQDACENVKQMTDLPVILFHSRYSLNDRMAIEKEVDACFGKQGDRSTGRILIGTQVLEQSLDYDVDWMITQLCPADLLFQRMGRLHRHGNNLRPDGFAEPKCTILLNTGEGYGTHDWVYDNTLVMWRTASKLTGNSGYSISFPAAYRTWIGEVYDESIHGDEPDWVIDGYENHLQAHDIKKMNARQMIKWAENTWLADTDETIQAVTRDGEMSLQLVPFVQTPKGKKLIDGTIVEQIPDLKLPEALTTNSVNVPGYWDKWVSTIDEEEIQWLHMQEMNNKWITETQKFRLEYTKNFGLKRERGKS